MHVMIKADGKTAPYARGELLDVGQAQTDQGAVRIANRARKKHKTGVLVYVDGKRQMITCDGRGPHARILDIICDA